jgi:quinol monooxygenase YgiN
MIVARFTAQARPEFSDRMAAAIAAVEGPSRQLPGVIHFDVAHSLTDPHAFLVVEVFEDRAALDRQNAQPEVDAMLALVAEGALTRDFEWTVWDIG